MKKLLLSSLLLTRVLFAEIEIAESIPLTETDLEALSESTTYKVDRMEASVPTDNQTNEVVDDSQWVNGMGDIATKVITKKSYLKGFLNGLAYNGDGITNLRVKKIVDKFYKQRDFSTFWISSDYAINPNIFEMIEAIKKAPNEGLESKKYHLLEIESILEIIKNSQGLSENERNIDIVKLDIYLTDAFLTMAKDLFSGECDMHKFKSILRRKKEELEINYSWDLPTKNMDYISLLSSLENSTNLQKKLFSLSNTNNMLESLKVAYSKYKDIQNQGGWQSIPRGRQLKIGSIDKKRVPLLAKRLFMSGDFDEYDYNSSKMSKPLSQALKHFQRRMGIWDSGKLNERTRKMLNISVEDRLDSIRVNISRLRSEVKDFGSEYILVNIPDFRMSFVQENQDVLGMRVVVGKKKNPTPIFSAKMSYFELNPYWTVPSSIVKKEMLHRIQEDPDYLVNRRFKMYNSWKQGRKEIDAFDIDWWQFDEESDLPYNFVKEPGAGNPLGFVKFMFPNSHAVYMHDTNEKKYFKSPVRAYSHGCIRLQKPEALLEFLTQNYTQSSLEKIESIKESKKNQSIRLNTSIPVHIRYITSWTNEDGGVNFRNDIYGYDKIQIELIK